MQGADQTGLGLLAVTNAGSAPVRGCYQSTGGWFFQYNRV